MKADLRELDVKLLGEELITKGLATIDQVEIALT